MYTNRSDWWSGRPLLDHAIEPELDNLTFVEDLASERAFRHVSLQCVLERL